MQTLKIVSTFALALLLASCGGGDSSDAAQTDGLETSISLLSKKVRVTRPGAVASMTLSSATSNSMVVTWTAGASSGTSAATAYKVGWAEGGTGRTWVSSAPHYPLSSSPLTLTGLLADTAYNVTVTPINSAGEGIQTTRMLSTTTAEATPPTDSQQTKKVVGGYYPNWTPSPVRIRDVNASYNVIYLFHAQPVGGPPGSTGAVYFNLPGDGRGAATNLVDDIRYARTVQGRKIILSVGGAGNGMSFTSRAKSQTFVDSVAAIYQQLGGFDGLDWNTYEADQAPDTDEMIWISLELKRRYPGFIITTPPAPWSERDMAFCQAMVQAGALDYAAPQYYDGPGLDVPSYVVDNIKRWVTLLGPEHVVVGFGIWDAVNYMSVSEAATAWNQVQINHPAIRGGFNWQIHTDEAAGWGFANHLGPLINPQQ